MAYWRAPTPSAAAELAVPDGAELLERIEQCRSRIKTAAQVICDRTYARIEGAERTAAHCARSILREAEMRVAELESRFKYAVKSAAAERETELRQLAARVESASPMAILARGYAGLSAEGERIYSVNQIKAGDEIELALADGRVRARAESVDKEIKWKKK